MARLPGDDVAAAVTRAVLELATTLGMELVAEGVETELQRATLEEFGCELAQGYLLGRPVFVAEFESALL